MKVGPIVGDENFHSNLFLSKIGFQTCFKVLAPRHQ